MSTRIPARNRRSSHRLALDHGLRTTTLFAAVAMALSAGQAQAQQAPAATAGGQLEEIVVTAERRETKLQSTPIAVSAISEALIESEAPKTIADIAAYVPNFSASKVPGFNAASFAMRGVGNTDIIVYNEAPVGVIVDDFVLPSAQTQLLDAFDVQQLEVLRGPQGTLFGKNTTGGAVVVHTKAPSLTDDSAEAQALIGSYNSVNAQGAINQPLINNVLGLRLVASSEREDGFLRNNATTTLPDYTGYGGTYHGTGERIGGTDVLTGRAKLLWQINDSVKTQLTIEMLRDRSQAPGAVNGTPSNPAPGPDVPYFVFPQLGLPGNLPGDPLQQGGTTNRQGFLIDMQNGHRVDAHGAYLNTDAKFDAGTLTWVQGYRQQESSLPSNYTGTVGPLSIFDANRSDIRKTWQEEVRFASNNDGAFNYVVGGFYQHDDTKFCVAQILGIYDLFGVPTPEGATPGGYNNNPQVLCNAQQERSAAVFGEGNYKFTEQTTLTIGARFTNDKKDWTGRQQVFVQQLGTTGTFDPNFTWQQLGGLMNAADFNKYSFGVVRDSHSWSVPTYRISLSHQFNPDVFGYGTLSHGFRAGGYNDQVGTSGNPISNSEKTPTNPEKADSIEFGLKTEMLDHRLRINEALFYVQYKDAIRQVVTPVTNLNGQPGEETLFRNAAKMTVYGIEHELIAQVTDNLQIRLPASYQHAAYNSFSSGIPGTASYVDLSNLDVNRAPKITAALGANYTVPMDGGSKVVLDASVNYVSKNLLFYSIALPYASFTQSYADPLTLLNASITYKAADDRWFVRVLGRNLANKIYIQSGETVDPLWIFNFYGEPRYVAGEFGVKFGKK